MASIFGLYFSQTTLLLSLLLLSTVALTTDAKVRRYKFNISYQYKSPDCFQKLTIAVNKHTPGPTIIAQQGDIVVVEVTNGLLTENTSIHWHGIRQIGTPWSDGTEGITQCPIQPGETFVYKFVVDRAGTYIYHAHYGMQKSAGLYGMIKVAVLDGVVEPFRYDFDRSIIVNDWWHKSTYELAADLLSIPFVFVGEPQSLLINGRGRFNCSLPRPTGKCNMTNLECSPSVFTVVPNKTYRFRIACITSLSCLNFGFEGHSMTVVEADGHYVKPFLVKSLNIYSGETYSVIVKADQDPSRNYWTTLNVVARKPDTTTGIAILNYYPNHPSRPPPTNPPAGPLWNDTIARFNQSIAIRSHPDYIETPPPTSDRMIILLNTQNEIDGHIRWALNNVSFTLPDTPYLVAIKNKLHHTFGQKPPPESYDYKHYDIYSVTKYPNSTYSSSIYKLAFNSTVDVILQNANSLIVNNSETHPWHLHGHDFWVLGYGLGKFDPSVDPIQNFNLVDPIQKNTVPLYPYGWTALRFRADNPGVWAFHCHIESRFFMGMGVVFVEGVEKVGRLPKAITGCGASKGLRALKLNHS